MQLNREALKAIRKRSNISQTAFAATAGIDRPTYAHIEAGRRQATDSQIIAIAGALVVPLAAVATTVEVAA